MDITATDFLKLGAQTAEHFGFSHLEVSKKNPACLECSKKLEYDASSQKRRQDSLFGLLSGGAQQFCEGKLHSIEGPVLFYSIESVPRTGDSAIAFHIYNVEKSIGEAIIIQLLRAFTRELGLSEPTIRINSIGDRDSAQRYVRELTNYLRKRLDEMPEAARELMKEHALSALMYLIEKEHDLAFRSPNPLEYLTDQSRKHFREIIEYLDMSEAPYEIDPKLIGHSDCYSEALFAVDFTEEDGSKTSDPKLSIRGGRYNEFIHRTTSQSIPAVGAVAILKNKKIPTRLPRPHKQNPSVFLVQLGFGPKIKSLLMIDELRKSGIAVHQDLANDSLSAQLRKAEALGVAYTIIIGQKEYVDGTVIMRDMVERNQENIPMSRVAEKLRRLATALT